MSRRRYRAASLFAAATLVTMIGRVAAAGPSDAKPETDWAKGLVTAPGIGLADRQAPNPAVARGPSRRRAEDAARAVLAASLPSLPLAGGGTLADKLADPAVKARIDAAVADAIAVTAEPETDGSWTVTMAVPVEAVRLALTGPRALPASGDVGPAVVIVDGVTASPAVGYTVGGLSAATVWVKDIPAWAKSAPRIKAKSANTPSAANSPSGANIDAPVGKATAATLFVLVPPR